MPGSLDSAIHPMRRLETRFGHRFVAALVLNLLTAPAWTQSARKETWQSDRNFVLRGDLVTMGERGVVSDGYLLLRGGRIRQLARGEAAGAEKVPSIRTNGWIFPGFINLHTHMPFNHQPLWVADRQFENRYQWQVYPPHVRSVMMPKWILFGPREYNLPNEQTLFAEVRALIGGTTALLSTRERSAYTIPGRLVRNIEYETPLTGRVEAHVAEVDDAFIRDEAPALRAAIERGELRAWVAHVAEGVDERSREELERLQRADLLRKEVVIVHGTGLDRAQLEELGAVEGHLVWAPTSNLLLYGTMADVKSAIEAGVTVSLSNDWAPSGTHNLLAELKVASGAYRHRYGSSLAPRTLVEMITTNPARAIGWETRAGSLVEGAQADVVVVARHTNDPYEDLLQATEEEVELVLIDGEPVFGRSDWMETLKPGDSELLEARGRNGKRYARRIDVTRIQGDMSLAQASARLRRALDFREGAMLESFFDASGRPLSAKGLARYLAEHYPGLEPQPLPPLFLSDDEEFFVGLRAMDFPFVDELEATYRPFAVSP
jgi:5-methylthioadenosine/S-adenosylhomocysteine deaminase